MSAVAERQNTAGHWLTILAAGGVAEMVLEFLAWWIAPGLVGKPMRPDILVSNLASEIAGTDISVLAAVSIHLLLGLIIFPLVYVGAQRVLKFRGIWFSAILYGVVLWAIAQMLLAPLAGRPFMLGLIPYTWFSLFAHVVYAVVFAVALDRLRE